MAPGAAWRQCLAAGMNEVVVKPVEPAELFAVIARWLPAAPVPAPAVVEPVSAVAATNGDEVSFDLGLSRCLGRRDLYLRVARRFIDTRAHDAGKLIDALAGGDDAALAHIAHTTVSTAGIIGAQRLSDIAARLQEAVRTGGGAPARAELALLVDAFAQAHAGVMREMAGHVATSEREGADRDGAVSA